MLPSKTLSSFLAEIAEWLALVAVAIVPLMFLPMASDVLELPKQTVLMVLVSLATLCLVGAMLANKTLTLRRTVANPIVLVLLLAVGVSALVNSARYLGVVGDSGEEYQSLMTTALFIAFFFIVVNTPERRPFASRAVFLATVVGGLISLLALFQFAGVRVLLGFSSSFNLVGSTVVLGLYAAVVVVMAATSFLVAPPAGKTALARRIAVGISGACAMLVAMVIDFWPIWAAMITGLIIVLIFAIIRPRAIRRLGWLTVPMIAVVIAALMLIVNVPLPIRPPIEIFPTLKQSLGVARDTLVGHPLFGTGPGTYMQDFAQHRAVQLNNSPVWYVQFDRGMSLLTTAAATLGLFGLVAWAAVLVIGVWKAAAYLIMSRKRDDEAWVLALAVSVSWLASAVGLVLYGASLASLLLFWLLFALLIRATSAGNAEVGFESSPRSGLTLTFLFVVLIVISLAGWFVSGTRLFADAAFVRAANLDASTKIDAVIANLESAANLNSQSDTTLRNLSQAYLLKVQALVADTKMDATTRGQQVQNLTDAAIKSATAATSLSPGNATDWLQLGSVYEAIMSYVGNSAQDAVKAYQKAADLDPTSPIYLTGIGRVYLAQAGIDAQAMSSAKDDAAKADAQKKVDSDLSQASDALNKALKLKSDYAPASYQLALVLDGQGKVKDAITTLEPVAAANPRDAGVGFELGLLYFHDGRKDQAEAVLKAVISLEPDYANAHWTLAALYEEQQKWDDAIAQVQAVLDKNPDNQTVKDRLQKLQDEKAGKATSGTPSAETAPIAPTMPQ